jgi:hypothetical protein
LSICRYWLCSATGPTSKVWDLESKNLVEKLRPGCTEDSEEIVVTLSSSYQVIAKD